MCVNPRGGIGQVVRKRIAVEQRARQLWPRDEQKRIRDEEIAKLLLDQIGTS